MDRSVISIISGTFSEKWTIFLPVPVHQSLDELSPSLPPEIYIERVEDAELSWSPNYPDVRQVVSQYESQARSKTNKGAHHGQHGAQGGFLKHDGLIFSKNLISSLKVADF